MTLGKFSLAHVVTIPVKIKCCSHLLNIMQNTSELKRIEEERRVAREIEAERVRQLIAAEKAKMEGEDRHNAVTLIAKIARGNRGRKYVIQKRAQMLLESSIIAYEKYEKAAQVLQANFRGYSTRKFLQTFGMSVPSNKLKKRKKKKTHMKKYLDANSEQNNKALKMQCAFRAAYELRQRRILVRLKLFYDLHRKFLSVTQVYSNLSVAGNFKIL
jgi:hypothetical protein